MYMCIYIYIYANNNDKCGSLNGVYRVPDRPRTRCSSCFSRNLALKGSVAPAFRV